jgi:alkylated DNA repair dioxygenase AlkB
MQQRELFGRLRLPPGMDYRPEFISPGEEAGLLEEIAKLTLNLAKYRQFTAKRRIISYGGSYDFSKQLLLPAEEIPDFLRSLRERVARWADRPVSEFSHALIAKYATGTQLGWHRDVPDFEVVTGISLGSSTRMRLRPYPPTKGRSKDSISLTLEALSAYILRDDARWQWQHSIPPTKATRYSITFRTRRTLSAQSRHSAPQKIENVPRTAIPTASQSRMA